MEMLGMEELGVEIVEVDGIGCGNTPGGRVRWLEIVEVDGLWGGNSQVEGLGGGKRTG